MPGPIPVPISLLPVAGPLTGAELLPAVQDSITVQTTAADLVALAPPAVSITFNAPGDSVTVPNTQLVEVAPGSGLHLSSVSSDTVTLTLADATDSSPGQVNTGNQTFSGDKLFRAAGAIKGGIRLVPAVVGGPDILLFDTLNPPGDLGLIGYSQADIDLITSAGPVTRRLSLQTRGGFTEAFLDTTGADTPRFATRDGVGVSGLGGGGDSFNGGIVTALGTPPPAASITFNAPGDSVTVPNTQLVEVAAGSGLHLSSVSSDTVTLTLADASGTEPGQVSTGDQTFTGNKTVLPVGSNSVGLTVIGGPEGTAGVFYGPPSLSPNPLSSVAFGAMTAGLFIYGPGVSAEASLSSGGGFTEFGVRGLGSDTPRFKTASAVGLYGLGGGGDSFSGGLFVSAGAGALISIGSPVAGSTPFTLLAVDGAGDLADVALFGAAGEVLTSTGPVSAPTFQALPPPGTGTVTSVDGNGGGTGLSLTGGPITSSGTLTLGGKLGVASGGSDADLSATAGLLWQASVGAAFTTLAIGSGLTVSGGTTLTASAPVTIGTAVVGATANSVLFIDGGGDLAQDNAPFNYTHGGGLTVQGNSSTTSVVLGGNSNAPAAQFGDGTRSLLICNGVYALDATAGLLNVIGSSGNTYRWNNSTTAPATQEVLAPPTQYFGAGVIGSALGTPDGWVLVNVGGTDVKIPVYLA